MHLGGYLYEDYHDARHLNIKPSICLMVTELINEIMSCGMKFSILCHRGDAGPLETLKEGDSILN
jgi:hypothetical protein